MNLQLQFHQPGRFLILDSLALEIQEKVLGKNNPELGVTLNNLGTLYSTQGKTQEAIPIYERYKYDPAKKKPIAT